jgi:hypothetical protein
MSSIQTQLLNLKASSLTISGHRSQDDTERERIGQHPLPANNHPNTVRRARHFHVLLHSAARPRR